MSNVSAPDMSDEEISLKQIGTGKYSDIFAVHRGGDSFAMKI